ncbi:MAG TPA: hypothetical protein VFH27_11435 [Longimicrobiaceae bacterium]|nr:hypothetical protein [Longimicrobiaceae bacterium]
MSTLEAAAVPVPHIAPPPPAEAAPAAEAAPVVTVALPFLEALPEGLVEGVQLPLIYRLAVPVPYDPGASVQRAAEDPEGGSALMACTPFYKPVSRCVGGR